MAMVAITIHRRLRCGWRVAALEAGPGYGVTDACGYLPVENPVHMHDIPDQKSGSSTRRAMEAWAGPPKRRGAPLAKMSCVTFCQ